MQEPLMHMKRICHLRSVGACAVLAMLLWIGTAAGAGKGVGVVEGAGGETVLRYGESHALVIGVSNYTAGWPVLESIPAEVERVERVLRATGFEVTRHMDPQGDELKQIIEGFLQRYGLAPDNRLLVFFSGHGHSRANGAKGYLVPADAPNPQVDEQAFLRKALSMTRVMSMAREMEAKHALFLFDSCFSGTIFKTRALPEVPPHITRLTAEPVRQFITAGSAGEEVPADSVFTPAFADAIEHGLADLDKDGYVTGTELGMFIQSTVPRFVAQTPQFGKIQDYDLSRGDFVFSVGAPTGTASNETRSITDTTASTKAGHLQINVDKSDTMIFVNGVQIGSFSPGTPYSALGLPTGDVAVRAIFSDGSTTSQVVAIRSGEYSQVLLRSPEEVASATTEAGRVSFALLPHDSNQSCFYSVGRDLEKAARSYLSRTGKGSLTYSYLDGSTSSTDVPSVSDLWFGSAVKREPNAALAAQSARALGADAVLMGWYHCNRNDHTTPDRYNVDVYLLDGQTDRVFDRASGPLPRINRMTQELLDKFFKARSGSQG